MLLIGFLINTFNNPGYSVHGSTFKGMRHINYKGITLYINIMYNYLVVGKIYYTKFLY